MNESKKYKLLIQYDASSSNNTLELNEMFIELDKNKDIMMFDVVYKQSSKELIHDFNKELIIKLNNFPKILDKEKDIIISSVKKYDFDTAFAFEMLGGSSKALKNIYSNYLEEYSNIDKSILNLLEQNDFEGIRKITHKIKGISSYIGSEKLLYLTEVLEYRIYNDLATKENIYEFLEYHNRILEYVKAQV